MTFSDLSRSQGEKRDDHKQIYGCDFSVREQKLVNFKQGPQGSWENYFSINTLNLDWKEQQVQNTERLSENQNPNGVKQVIKLLSCKRMLPFMRKKGWRRQQKQELGKKSPQLQRIKS